MNENEERKTGFAGIGNRIKDLAVDIDTTEQPNLKQTNESSQPAKNPSAKNSSTGQTKPIKSSSSGFLSAVRARLRYEYDLMPPYAKMIFWGIVVFVVIGLSRFVHINNTSLTQPQNIPAPAPEPAPEPAKSWHDIGDDQAVSDGQYKCTEYHNNRAEELKPSLVEKENIERQLRSLTEEKDALNVLKTEIESDSVDNDSQSSIDQHNLLVHNYNSQLRNFKIKGRKLQQKMNDYDAQVKNYNNYLSTNCTKAN